MTLGAANPAHPSPHANYHRILQNVAEFIKSETESIPVAEIDRAWWWSGGKVSISKYCKNRCGSDVRSGLIDLIKVVEAPPPRPPDLQYLLPAFAKFNFAK